MKKYINFSFAILILALANPAFALAQTCTPAPVNLVSWYSGDNDGLDSRSRNNGMPESGAGFAGGKVGQAFNLPIQQSSVAIPNNPALFPPNALSIEGWVKPSTYAGCSAQYRIFHTVRAVLRGYVTFIDCASQQFVGQIFDSSGNANTIYSNSTFPAGIFTHFAMTWDGANLRIYVNGVLDNTAATTISAIGINTDPLRIGNENNFGFVGQIDEISLYNRALSASEIAAIANAGNGGKCKPTATVAPSGQVAWLTGDGNANDIAGTNNGTLQSGVKFTVGKVGQSFSLDGNDDSIQLPLNQSFQNFTLESWVKPNSAVSDPISQELILGQAGFGSQMVVRPGSDGGMRVVIQYRDALNSFAQVVSTGDIPLNDWSHLVGTFDGTTLKLYINGVLNAQSNPTNTTVQTCNTPYFIGGLQSVTDCNAVTNPPFQFFNGLIDEASVYNRALIDAEITSVFNAGSAGKLKTNSTIDTNSLVSLWQGENNANDARGANNGTFTANTYAAGRIGQAFNFLSLPGVIVPDNATLNTQNFTLEAFVTANTYSCPAGANTCQAFIIAKSGAADTSGYEIGVRENGRLRYSLNGGAGGADVVGNINIADGNFHHVAATYDGATMKLYVDGILDAQKSVSTVVAYQPSSQFHIGGREFGGNGGAGSSNFPHPGEIDEAAFYNRALTAVEIHANYEAGNALSTVVGDARIFFPTVSAVGTTQQIPLDKNLFPALPMGAMHTGLFYDIDTSAAFTGSPAVCFNLPSFTPAQFAFLGVMHFENNNWVNVTAASNTYPTLCTVPVASFSPFAIVNFAPTAAAVSVSGRVREAGGKGIAQAQVSLSDASGETRSVSTNQSGFYQFDDVAAGETYVLTVTQKRRVFPDSPRVLFVSEELAGVDFTATAGGLRGN